MNYMKVGCFLAILFCLLANMSAMAGGRLITCTEQWNQSFVCLPDAVALVKNHIGRPIRIIGYSKAEQGAGWRNAAKFRRQLIDALIGEGIRVNKDLFKIG